MSECPYKQIDALIGLLVASGDPTVVMVGTISPHSDIVRNEGGNDPPRGVPTPCALLAIVSQPVITKVLAAPHRSVG